jgi:hypothetical protein
MKSKKSIKYITMSNLSKVAPNFAFLTVSAYLCGKVGALLLFVVLLSLK